MYLLTFVRDIWKLIGLGDFTFCPKLKLCSDYAFQVILLSATMPRDVLDVTCKFMRDPIRILVKKEELTLEGIKQFFVLVEKEVSYHCLGVLHNWEFPTPAPKKLFW